MRANNNDSLLVLNADVGCIDGAAFLCSTQLHYKISGVKIVELYERYEGNKPHEKCTARNETKIMKTEAKCARITCAFVIS